MAPARPIVLLTDFGSDDFYAGVMRAVIAAGSPASRTIDLGHGIPAHDIGAASFVLARSVEYLPADAIVVVVVDPGVGGRRRGLVLRAEGRTLIGPDNGFASDLVASGATPAAFAIDDDAAARVLGSHPRGATFHGRDLFGPLAAAMARGVDVEEFASPAAAFAMLPGIPSVSIDGARAGATGRYVDRFGNVMSDLPLAVVRRVCGEVSRARVSIDGRDVGPLVRTYEDAGDRLAALVNGWGLVEAAVGGGRAVDRLGSRSPTAIRFEIRAG